MIVIKSQKTQTLKLERQTTQTDDENIETHSLVLFGLKEASLDKVAHCLYQTHDKPSLMWTKHPGITTTGQYGAKWLATQFIFPNHVTLISRHFMR